MSKTPNELRLRTLKCIWKRH